MCVNLFEIQTFCVLTGQWIEQMAVCALLTMKLCFFSCSFTCVCTQANLRIRAGQTCFRNRIVTSVYQIFQTSKNVINLWKNRACSK